MHRLLEILSLDSYRLIAFVLEYLVVFVAICADLFAGLRKAKKENKLRTSFGFRKTLDKILQYYGVLFFLSFIDILQMYLVGGLINEMGWKLFAFPIITFIGTIYICIIEYRSIKEKRDAKENARIDEVTRLLSELIKDNKNFEAVDNLITTLRKIKDVNEE
jgi:hypothetical protein